MQHEADKWARVSNRASPVMETLGGLAVGVSIVYTSYLVIYRGAEPGAFMSFLAAFLLAYEPAKRLSRLNLELANHLVGVRMLFEVMDSSADRAERRRQAAAPAHQRARRVRRCALRLSARTIRYCAACRSSPSPAR